MTTRRVPRTLRIVIVRHGVLALPLALFIVFEAFLVIRLPVVGIHAWNESVYLSFASFMRQIGNPFVFKAAYDPSRPDYNVGYLFFWAYYVFQMVIGGVFNNSVSNFLVLSRIFSFGATLASCVMIYKIVAKLTGQVFSSQVAVVIFLFSPLVLYFGTKFQLEPFTFLVFLMSWLSTIYYEETGKPAYLLLGFFILGTLLATRQIFAIYTPALLLTTMLGGREHRILSRVTLLGAACALVSGFFAPLALTQLIVPEYAPFKFQLYRLEEAPTLATSLSGQSGNLVSQYVEKSLLPSLGLSFLFVPALAMAVPPNRMDRVRIVGFGLGAMSYFAFAFVHNIVHMYHSYYFLPIVILGVIYVGKFVANKKGKRAPMLLTVFLVVSSAFSVYETASFYGIGSNVIYHGVDPYGNLDSVFAGYYINYLYHESKDRGLLDPEIAYYSLVQSPALYYYTDMPSLSYLDFYQWDQASQQYKGFNFYTDQNSFLQALKERNLFILTVTPDVSQSQTAAFRQYYGTEFSFIGSEGVYTFYLNRTIFERATSSLKEESIGILNRLEKSQLAPSSVSESIMNMSRWFRVSNNFVSSTNTTKNLNPQKWALSLGDLNNSSLTLEISMTPSQPPAWETILSIDNVLNVKFGTSNDLFLEMTSTAEGYRWISGVDMTEFYWQRLTVTFVYDANLRRAEIFFNGILMSNTLLGTNETSFSPIQLPQDQYVKIFPSSNGTQLYSIRLWNQSLTYDQIEQPTLPRPAPTFVTD